jgi:Spy/CpxP family protein refolding chaperone
MKKWIFIALVLSLAFNFGFLGAFIYRSLERRPPAIEEIEEKIIRRDRSQEQRMPENRPGLRTEQVAELKEIRQAFQPRFKRMRQEVMREKKKLGKLLLAVQIDSTAIRTQLEQIARVQLRLEQEVIKELLKEREVMEPHQREIFIQAVIKRLQGGVQQGNPRQPNPNKNRNRENNSQNSQRRNP